MIIIRMTYGTGFADFMGLDEQLHAKLLFAPLQL